MSEKATALVLRTVEFSETSLVVWLFTREFGKIHALAKGARRPKSPFESALDLLSTCRVVFLHKSSGTLDLLTEAKLERRFRGRGRDLSCLYAGYYVAELLDGLTDDYDSHPELFDAAIQTLNELASEGSPAALVLRFELVALRLLGHLPSLTACAECGAPTTWSGRIGFSATMGGVLCPACRPGKPHVVSVSPGAMALWRTFAADGEEWRDQRLASPEYGELRGVFNHFLVSLLGKPLKLHPFLAAAIPRQSIASA